MNTFSFWLPTKIVFERGGLEKGLRLAAGIGHSAFIVCGKNFASGSGLLNRITRVLSETRVTWTTFAQIKPEPDIENVEEGFSLYQRSGGDMILAVGGGSALDAGKAIAVLATNGGKLRDYFGVDKFGRKPLPVVAVPTTCGTGSEVTQYAVIVDRQAETKRTISSESIIPELAILDSDLLKTLPPLLVAATAMDAFSHAVESFLAVKANWLSRSFSLASLNALLKAIPQAVTEKEREKFKEIAFYGSMMAGLALNQTGTILIHGMGYVLTIFYGLHHGTANALL
ncbi:MAG: iron-containing alcohol dehydrogenase, partial [Candidatus Omnitrophica bacterium]|nr:iron-containing alcohol dehydrogenase [Candidatus Omnitrophota bacterium]